jgi:hypothetical protein
MAMYNGPMQKHCAYIVCAQAYNDFDAKVGNHSPLGILLLKYNMDGANPNKARRMLLDNHRFPTIRKAIEFVEWFVEQPKYQDWLPKII